jgi:hypothetical protein
MGMGGCGIAIANDAVAWAQNPAGLGARGVPCEAGKTWSSDVLGAYDKQTDHAWGLNWSGWAPSRGFGVGAGYFNMPSSKLYGAGVGFAATDSPLSFGLNAVRYDPTTGHAYTLWDAGALYQMARHQAAPVRFGALAADIGDETGVGPWYDLAVAWPVAPRLLVAVDATDVTDRSKHGPYYSAGAELSLGNANEWKARAGVMDTGNGHDLTLGAGYSFAKNWRVDGAWVNSDPDKTWSVGVGVGF